MNDPGFMLLNLVAARAGLGMWAVNALCAALFFTGLLRFARRLDHPPLALLIAGPVLILVGIMGAMRQAAAVGLLLWALDRHGSGRTGRAGLLIVAAAAMHWTAAILLPLPLLMRLSRPPPLWLLPALAAATFLAVVAAAALAPGLFPKLDRLPVSLGAAMRVLPTFAALAAMPLVYRRAEPAPAERLAAGYLAAIALLALCFLPWLPLVADRLNYFAVPLQMLVLTRAVTLAPAGPRRLLAHLAAALPFVALSAGWLQFTAYRACVLPYRSYLEAPERLLPLRAPEGPRASGACARAFEPDLGPPAPQP